jgi:AraC-like DNA-binding protein
MRSRYSVIDTAGLQSIMGVVFWPGGAHGFFDVPADEFYNQVVPLDWVWGSAVTELRDRLRDTFSPAETFRVLETTLRRRAGKRLELHAAVRYALEEFRRVPHTRSVLDVTRHAGLSRRRFAQLFREPVGLTPKLSCRLRRFRQVVGQIASGRACGLGRRGAGGRLLGSGAFRSRISRFLRHFARRVSLE